MARYYFIGGLLLLFVGIYLIPSLSDIANIGATILIFIGILKLFSKKPKDS